MPKQTKQMTGTIEDGKAYFKQRGWTVFDFQEQCWQAYLAGQHGILNAPTGFGKTLSLVIPFALNDLHSKPKFNKNVLRAIWITPLRALAREIAEEFQSVSDFFDLNWDVAVRTGDTSYHRRKKIYQKAPDVMVTTPESLHVLLATEGYSKLFSELSLFVVDEWHELIGGKRGVQVELALSKLNRLASNLRVWGISATIGNMDEAKNVLLHAFNDSCFIRCKIKKQLAIKTILPKTIEELPWAGHLGIKLIDKLLPVLDQAKTTLVFTNTRSQCEIWFKIILDHKPEWAGLVAMHHGSVDRKIREYIETALDEGELKVVVCTSSLDLGVDFRPVEQVIQVGSPKGIARFVQRAGRAGHDPYSISKIYFLPTQSLELIELSALRDAVNESYFESRVPMVNCIDVLVQYVVSLAISEGVKPEELFNEVKSTYAYADLHEEEWNWILFFITRGGKVLQHYSEYQKVILDDDGLYKVIDPQIARRHKLAIGTIVSDSMMNIKYLSGKRLGQIEEWFISRVNPGDNFWFGGKSLELIKVKGNDAIVKPSKAKGGMIPSWLGGRLPLSSNLTTKLRIKLGELRDKKLKDTESHFLQPLIELQAERSIVPDNNEFLVEILESREGFHYFFYPFEGRLVHEGLGALFSYRIAQKIPISFSIAINDYGIELLSDKQLLIETDLIREVISPNNLVDDINRSMNSMELAKRKFRDVAAISGLTFQGFPGRAKKERYLQASSNMIFDVLSEHEEDNLLIKQAYREVLDLQLEETRMRDALKRMQSQKIVLKQLDKPSPFAFPIMVERLRDKLSSENVEDRIKKMSLRYGVGS